jgi:hypothetical protein
VRNLPTALLSAVLVLLLQLFTFSALLGSDILSRTLQFLFYGPFLAANRLLRLARDSWDAPIPTTMFGGFPGWLNGLLLIMNWLLCSLFVFVLVTWVGNRARGRDHSGVC